MLPLGSRRNRGNLPDLGPDADHLYAVPRATPSSAQKSSIDIQRRPVVLEAVSDDEATRLFGTVLSSGLDHLTAGQL
jgi:hypothetical protein